jgi:hypothetical protein
MAVSAEREFNSFSAFRPARGSPLQAGSLEGKTPRL